MLKIIISLILFTACQDHGHADRVVALGTAHEARLAPYHRTPLSEQDLAQLSWRRVELPQTVERDPELEYLLQAIELPEGSYAHPAILFERIHQSFRIELDGQTLITHGTPDKAQASAFQGFSWHIVPLPPDFRGKTLRIYSRSSYRYIGIRGLPLLGEAQDLVAIKARQGWPGFVSSSIMAAMFILILLAHYNEIRSFSLSSIAFYSLISGLFTVAINPLTPLLFPGSLQWAYIEMFTLFSLPPFGILALASVLDPKSQAFLLRYSVVPFSFLGFVTLGEILNLRPIWNNYTLFNFMNILSMCVVISIILKGMIMGYVESLSISLCLLIVVVGAVLESLSSLQIIHAGFSIFPLTNLFCILVLLNLALKTYFQVQKQLDAQRQTAEEERMQLVLAKERSIHSLVGGIAHEFNNPLAIILMSLGNLQKGLLGLPHLAASVPRSIHMIEKAIHRVSSLNARLLQLSELQSSSGGKVTVNLTQLIQNCCHHPVEVRILSEDSRPGFKELCFINPEHFQSVLQTLTDNAQEALQTLPDDQRRPIQLTVSYARDSISIDCIDWGPGVADEDIPHLFNPFFSTKDVGEGMGINLFFAREYARSMGGDLALINPRQPTQFRITLPTSSADAVLSA